MRGGAQGRTLDVTSPAYGARGDGRSDDTEAVRRAIEDARQGDVVAFPRGRVFLIDSIDLGVSGAADLTLMVAGATVRKHPAGRFGNTNTEHVFFDRLGTCDGLRVIGGRFELSRDAATPGDTVSAFFLVRLDRLFFALVEIDGGIEEGAKLYKCRNVTWVSPRISNCRNNGIQCHAPVSDSYMGTMPNRGWSRWRVYGGRIRDVDDGLSGKAEGQGITFNSTDPDTVCEDVLVEGVTVEGCNRGLWAEFNEERTRGRRIAFRNNLVLGSRWYGIGQVGVVQGTVAGNHVVDTGFRRPGPDSSSEVAGIVVSGSTAAPSEDVHVIENAVLDERAATPWMQYGIDVRQSRGTIVERNRVRGASEMPYRIDEATASGRFELER